MCSPRPYSPVLLASTLDAVTTPVGVTSPSASSPLSSSTSQVYIL